MDPDSAPLPLTWSVTYARPSTIRGAPLELHPLDDQQPLAFSRDDDSDPNLPSSLDFGRELESLELGLKTAGGRISSR